MKKLNQETNSLKNLRIADLELFITAARLKSLGKAAKLHYLSQSAASAVIERVEFAFGRLLCKHEKRQFKLTKEGELLLPKAEAWLRDLKETVAKKEKAPLRVATTQALARVLIPSAIVLDKIELKLMRPDHAYRSLLQGESDVAICLDNALWEGVTAEELGITSFQLYSSNKNAKHDPVLIPEDQMEVLSFQQKWQEFHNAPLPIKSRLPSWSLIYDICKDSKEIGFLPCFLTLRSNLFPISDQPKASKYRILALYRNPEITIEKRLKALFKVWKLIFTN